jgi:hypothetical protein
MAGGKKYSIKIIFFTGLLQKYRKLHYYSKLIWLSGVLDAFVSG